jgi:CelD/BcsL family acetyltransferase involved in cellulose biosynthesis
MECEIVEATALSSEHRDQWSNIVRQQPSLDAPAFYPEFVCSLAAHIPNCKVAILSEHGTLVGYIAFLQRPGTNAAISIPMCDYGPVIIGPGRALEARLIVRAMALKSWTFENIVTTQLSIGTATRFSQSVSPRAVLKDGYESYLSQLNAAGKSSRKFQTNVRLLERDHGSVTVVHSRADEATLTSLLEHKSKQFTSDGRFPAFVHGVLAHFLRQKTGPLTGSLSVLKAGENEIALAYCLKAGRLLYYWFPTYDPTFQKYSPGLVLLSCLIRDLPSLGCDTIDFGPGGESYKEYFANDHRAVCSGEVHSNKVLATIYRTTDRLDQAFRSNAAVRNCIKPVLRKFRELHSRA